LSNKAPVNISAQLEKIWPLDLQNNNTSSDRNLLRTTTL